MNGRFDAAAHMLRDGIADRACPAACLEVGRSADPLWRESFESDPAVIGSAIELNGVTLVVVGVTPPEFRGSIVGLSTRLASALTITRPEKDPGDSRHGDAVLLKLTSGSSGLPRATRTPETVLVADSSTLMNAMDVGPDDLQIAAIPLSHAYGIGNLVVPLFIYGTPIVMREAFVPHRLPDDARRYGARVFPGGTSCSNQKCREDRLLPIRAKPARARALPALA